MNMSGIESKANFFETRVSEYSKACVSFKSGESGMPSELTVDLDDDF